jgi:protein-S-isoprenylcysteine O-methyltransferase Ste14
VGSGRTAAASAETWLAARRVPLGFVAAVAVLVLGRPTWTSWAIGLAVALAGEALRVWAAGHLEKSREVTRTGPYRWVRHPLYAGSTGIAAGVAVACASLVVAVVIAVYMVVTVGAAVRTEEAFLSRAFGDTYQQYRESRAAPVARAFSLERARRNREYRAVVGLALGFALLALRVLL